MTEINELEIYDRDEINLILKLRNINAKKHTLNIIWDIQSVVEAFDEIYDEQYQKRGLRLRFLLDDKFEVKNALKLANKRTHIKQSKEIKKMGGRISRVDEIQKDVRRLGYKFFIPMFSNYLQEQLEKKFAKSTIYEALRKL